MLYQTYRRLASQPGSPCPVMADLHADLERIVWWPGEVPTADTKR